MDIDDVDFSILNVIAKDDAPLWKKEIHRGLSETPHALPNVREVSVQTVGRRVDDLHDDGYLESCIISPRDINRDLIIAFKITDAGEAARHRKREELLRDHVYHTFSRGNADLSADTDTLATLTVDEIGLDADLREELADTEPLELLTLLLLYYTRDAVDDRLDEESVDRLAELAATDERIGSLLTDHVIGSGVADAVDDNAQDRG